jgi:L,D-peptidoglycan transpeptidase YkuD (ErfK/YbiS/YcfS/YnhG family)
MPRWALLAGVLVALQAVAAPPSHGAPAACDRPPGAAAAQARGSSQLVTVVAAHRNSTHATVRLWRRAADGCFVAAAGPWAARVGKNGVAASRREGDGTTPRGVFGIAPVLYGNGPDPGVRYRYHRLACGDWWDEDASSPTYNRFVQVRCGVRPSFAGPGTTGLWEERRAYRYFAVVEFNVDPVVPGRGSGIFIHVDHGRPTTGCVSLPLNRLVALLRWLRPGLSPLVAIVVRSPGP